jgi:predicted transposase YbfD/YdcC
MDNIDVLEGFEDFLSTIKDPRLERSKLHSLAEILFLVLVATLSGVDGWKSIEYFGEQKLELLREFYPYQNGIPSDDTIRRLLRRLGHRHFQAAFQQWIKSLEIDKKMAIAIDGKTSRASTKESGVCLHTVSAFSAEHRLVLGQQKTNDKSNEITAIPKLLDALSITGATVTIDAIGCQKEICQKIISKEADYCIAVKDNQPTLHQDVKELFEKGAENKLKIVRNEQKDKGHGRMETRLCEMIKCPEEFLQKHQAEWMGIKTVVKITSHRVTKEGESTQERYYISSKKQAAKDMNNLIRGHWSVENNLHWILDTAFNDDKSRIHLGNAPINMMTIKHFALNLLQKAKTETESIKMLRGAAGWNKNTLMRILSKIG